MEKEMTLLHGISSEQFFEKFNELKIWFSENVTPSLRREKVEELMTIDEVAVFFKKHKDTIENWSQKGYLTKNGIGRAIYYKRSEVESAIIPLR